jgi:lipopolysaccharide heptosyltransferase I
MRRAIWLRASARLPETATAVTSSNSTRRVLIVRLGALGDIVHAIPVAAALRRAWPDARIDWMVSAKHREILELVPAVDARLIVNDRRDSDGGLTLLQAIRAARRTAYDVTLDLQGLIKSAAVARATGAPKVVGFTARYCREPLARAFYTAVYDPGRGGIYARDETRHVVQINLGILQTLGLSPGAPEFPIAHVESAVAAQIAAATSGRYALLNTGAAWPNKRWPPERLAALARALHTRHGLMSVVLWGPGEQSLADEVVASAPGAAISSPPTTIADVVALTRGASVMVSGDTGPTHIGAAVGTPIVGLYGPTRPERNGPWLPEDETVTRAAVCECHHLRSCRRAGRTDGGPVPCLLDIQVDEVLAAVERRLAAGRRG